MTTRERMTRTMKAVSEHPSRVPLIYWPLSVAIIAFGFFRLETHHHVETGGYVHLGSDWAVILLGVAFLPGAAQKVGELLKVLRPFVPWIKNGGNGGGGGPSGPSS